MSLDSSQLNIKHQDKSRLLNAVASAWQKFDPFHLQDSVCYLWLLSMGHNKNISRASAVLSFEGHTKRGKTNTHRGGFATKNADGVQY